MERLNTAVSVWSCLRSPRALVPGLYNRVTSLLKVGMSIVCSLSYCLYPAGGKTSWVYMSSNKLPVQNLTCKLSSEPRTVVENSTSQLIPKTTAHRDYKPFLLVLHPFHWGQQLRLEAWSSPMSDGCWLGDALRHYVLQPFPELNLSNMNWSVRKSSHLSLSRFSPLIIERKGKSTFNPKREWVSNQKVPPKAL